MAFVRQSESNLELIILHARMRNALAGPRGCPGMYLKETAGKSGQTTRNPRQERGSDAENTCRWFGEKAFPLF